MLDAAQAAWDKKREDTYAALNNSKKTIDAELRELEQQVTVAHDAFNKAIKYLEDKLEDVKRVASVATTKAEQAIQTASQESQKKLEELKQTLATREQELTSTFGDVDKAIDNAQRKLDSAQG